MGFIDPYYLFSFTLISALIFVISSTVLRENKS